MTGDMATGELTRRSTAVVHDDPLVPIGGRFPLGRVEPPVNAEPPSAPRTRPFALRFAREPSRVDTPPLPPHRYCPERQILVTDDDAALPVVDFTPTTVGDKDGKGGPQEDWKPDLPFHEEP